MYVAVGYSLLVCALLVADAAVRLTKVPLEVPQFLELQDRLVNSPGETQVIEDIRVMDFTLRQQYFRQRHFTMVGSYLLLAGLLVALVAFKWAVTLRRKLPLPVVKVPGPDSDQRLSRTGMWAVTALVVGVLVTIGHSVPRATHYFRKHSSSSLHFVKKAHLIRPGPAHPLEPPVVRQLLLNSHPGRSVWPVGPVFVGM